MNNALAWIAAAGGVAATIGTWLGPVRTRWQLRIEELRTSRARRENELHRARLAEVWHWWHDQPGGPQRAAAARWYSEWTGAAHPFKAAEPGPMAPGIGCADAEEAYDRYVAFFDAVYQPGRLGPPRPALTEADATGAAEQAGQQDLAS